MKKPIAQSQELFNDYFGKLCNKIEETENTIFTGLNFKDLQESTYISFLNNKEYYEEFISESSIYEKNKVINAYLINESFSEIYTQTYDRLLLESEANELSFKQAYLTESTEDVLKVKYKGLSLHELEVYEEGMLGSSFGVAAATGAAGVIGMMTSALALPLTLAASASVFALKLFLSSRNSRKYDDWIQETLGSFGYLMAGLGTKDRNDRTNSRANSLTFDNIDLNPTVSGIFKQLSRGQGKANKDLALKGLEEIIEKCIENNNLFSDTDIIDDDTEPYLDGKYNPRKENLFLSLKREFFGDSTTDKKLEQSIIGYRKCLADNLTDMYKFLMIANLSNTAQYKKILHSLDKGFNVSPEHLLSFMPDGEEHEAEIKTKIILLIKLRIGFNDIAKGLNEGTILADREAGKYFTNKLKTVDREIEQYVRSHGTQIDTIFETQKEFEDRRLKGDKIPEKDLKRSYLNL